MTQTANIPGPIKPFAFHGFKPIPETLGEKQVRGECPFCHHSGKKFHVNKENQLWDCKHCHRTGNLTSFLQQFYDERLKSTTQADYRSLSEMRLGIKPAQFKEYGFAICNMFSDPRWLIPVYSTKKTLINLRVYSTGTGEVWGTSTIKQKLWRLHTLSGQRGPVIICEGEWDAMALERLRRKAGKTSTILSTPGSGIFSKDWASLFSQRDVYFIFDNDEPGSYQTKHAKALTGYARTAKCVKWPTGTPDGYDVRDYVIDMLDKQKADAKQAWDFLLQMCEDPHTIDKDYGDSDEPERDYELPTRNTFRSVLTDFRKAYHIEDQQKEALRIMLAVTLSIQLEGDPLWLFLVGPPGSGKTLLVEGFRDCPEAIFKSSLTPKSLISGWAETGDDPSLIPKLNGRVLILKDFTEILTMGRDEQKEIFGILRGAYDGFCEKTFGNGITRQYDDCHFAMVAGVTDLIHKEEQGQLGERFIKYQMIDGVGYDPTDHIRRALSGMKKQSENDVMIRRCLEAFTTGKNLKDNPPPNLPVWAEDRIVYLAQIVAHLRAVVERKNRDEIAFRAAPEVGTRLAKQLAKLAQCLAVVDGKKKIDQAIFATVERVALDTARGWNLDIVRTLVANNNKPLQKAHIESEANVAPTTCGRRLEDMMAVGTVVRGRPRNAQPGPGQPAFGYQLSDQFYSMWKKAKIGKRRSS